MRKIIGIILGILVAGGLVYVFATGIFGRERVNYDDYDLWSVLENDNVKGNREAKALIFEYADYQCSGCANMWPRLSKVLEEFDGEVGLVYRNFLLSYHQNGTAAASAAEAAAKQGYWEEMAEYLFNNQSTWAEISASQRKEVFSTFFETVSGGEGDTEKFISDMGSAEVKKKISFDMGAGQKLGVTETPGLYVNSEKIDFKGLSEDEFYKLMREKIKAALKEGE